jgi:porphobilinogen synthase
VNNPQDIRATRGLGGGSGLGGGGELGHTGSGQFPERRMRRLRRSTPLRDLLSETSLTTHDMVFPLFVREDIDSPIPIATLPGHLQHTVQSAVEKCRKLVSLGIPGVIFFGIPANKDPQGTGAWDPSGIVQMAIYRTRDAVGDDLVIISDLCLDEYTSHGHCGVLDSRGQVENDTTLELYQKIAISQARAGADMLAPSGMMDGQVSAIRSALDTSGFTETAILAYAAKYASSLYGPFRDAVNVHISGDRKSYQEDIRNAHEAILETTLDIAEGADIVMVKPAISYLDVIARISSITHVPVAAYQVSGEYSMIKAAGERGWIDADAVMLEQLISIKRAGARFIVTYAAEDVAKIL